METMEPFAMPDIEPSGLAYQASTRSLYVVGDQGKLVQLHVEADGRLRRVGEWQLAREARLDLEGIALGGDRLFVLEERAARILEVDWVDGGWVVGTAYPLPKKFRWEGEKIRCKGSKNKGFEGLTCLDAAGTVFAVSRQSGDSGTGRGQAVVYEVTLTNDGKRGPEAVVTGRAVIDAMDLAAMCFDHDVHHVVSAENDTLLRFDRTWTPLGGPIAIPGDGDAEGIAKGPDGLWFLAIDGAREIRTVRLL